MCLGELAFVAGFETEEGIVGAALGGELRECSDLAVGERAGRLLFCEFGDDEALNFEQAPGANSSQDHFLNQRVLAIVLRTKREGSFFGLEHHVLVRRDIVEDGIAGEDAVTQGVHFRDVFSGLRFGAAGQPAVFAGTGFGA